MPAIPKPTREPKVYRSFKRPERPARVPAVHKPLTRPVVYGEPVAAAPVPKREYVRSEALRRAMRLIPCQWDGCGVQDGTVCCAHSNSLSAGKGKGIKASDDKAAALCAVHHHELDQGHRLTKQQRAEHFERAHARTVRELTARGLWPAGVPVPEIESNPFEVEA